MTVSAGPCSEGAGDAPAALAALKAAVQATGAAAPSANANTKAAWRGRRGAGGRKGLRAGGVAVVVLDEMDQLLASDAAVLTELFLLPKARASAVTTNPGRLCVKFKLKRLYGPCRMVAVRPCLVAGGRHKRAC